MKRTKPIPPTEAEIRAYRNVPVDAAAKFIGWSTVTVYNALKEERAPFGFAAQNPATGSWTYHISPGLLIKYQNGELPTYRLNEVINLAAEGVGEVVELKLAKVSRLFSAALEV